MARRTRQASISARPPGRRQRSGCASTRRHPAARYPTGSSARRHWQSGLQSARPWCPPLRWRLYEYASYGVTPGRRRARPTRACGQDEQDETGGCFHEVIILNGGTKPGSDVLRILGAGPAPSGKLVNGPVVAAEAHHDQGAGLWAPRLPEMGGIARKKRHGKLVAHRRQLRSAADFKPRIEGPPGRKEVAQPVLVGMLPRPVGQQEQSRLFILRLPGVEEPVGSRQRRCVVPIEGRRLRLCPGNCRRERRNEDKRQHGREEGATQAEPHTNSPHYS